MDQSESPVQTEDEFQKAWSVDSCLANLNKSPRRMAPFQWFGGKGMIAAWIVKHLPSGLRYIEPYAGAASVFWHLPKPYPIEVLNDIDKRIVAVFRVLQDREKFEELKHRVTFTLYHRDEYMKAWRIANEEWDQHDEVTRAWAFMVATNQGFAGNVGSKGWGKVLTAVNNNMPGTVSRWRSRMRTLDWWHDRLTRVQIDCVDGIQCIEYWDGEEAVFYVDPPYVKETWGSENRDVYDNIPENDYHERLINTLLNIKGKAIVSGYDNPVYRRLDEAGWKRIEKKTTSHAAGRTRGSKLQGRGSAKKHASRTEVIWISPNSIDQPKLIEEQDG